MIQEATFVLFGAPHLITLVVIFLFCVWIGFSERTESITTLAWFMAGLLIAQEFLKLYLFIGVHAQPWQQSLPLDICRINEFLCVWLLVRRSYRVFEVAYFWSIGGSVSALLTPDLAHAFPDTRFLLFFFGHGLVVVVVVYAIFGYGFRPRLRSVFTALAVLGIYAVFIAGLNVLLDTNYLFLREKPEGTSIMDFFGPWPIYLFALTALAALICFLSYLPFALASRWIGSGSNRDAIHD